MRNAKQGNDLNCLLKLSLELVSLINLGRAFHNLGAANTKARSPGVALTLILGKLSKVPSLELLKLCTEVEHNLQHCFVLRMGY